MNTIEHSEIIQCPTPRINLATAEDIRREMGRVYREARSGKLPTSEATKLTYILTQILRATEVYLLEQRLSALELTHSGGAI
jgi:hypothetical protein